ncbi:MAG TPA: hypothetical protein VHC95_02120 [Opitutales bacterium]|nr:hypothetical protein [Opitutales bacterium]
MNWLWISGWAVPPAWLAAQAQAVWPEARHAAVAPADAARALNSEKFNVLGGYSLGALWLLHQEKAISDKIPVLLLAPIFAFTTPGGRGGRTAPAQLRLQRRRLRDQPAAAIADFYQRTKLAELAQDPATAQWNSARHEDLAEELAWLETWRAGPPPPHWHGFAGSEDPLLDAAGLKKFWPLLRIVPGTGHTPGPLMNAARESFTGEKR